MVHDKIFVTGCDKNTFWQLNWFISNLLTHTTSQLYVYDFGWTSDQLIQFNEKWQNHVNYVKVTTRTKGWFNKPRTLQMATKLAKKVCWLDTDCEVVGDLESVFDHSQSGCIAMAEDHPWNARRGGGWLNSGVIVIESPESPLLHRWIELCENQNSHRMIGDQEIFREMVKADPLCSLSVRIIPHKYNVLRLDIQDGTVPNDVRVYHWTGSKGNEKIQRKIYHAA